MKQDWVDLFNNLCGGLRVELSGTAGGRIETFKSKSQWEAYVKNGTRPSEKKAELSKGKGKGKNKAKRPKGT